jgi:hypothetical protein
VPSSNQLMELSSNAGTMYHSRRPAGKAWDNQRYG